MAIIESGVLTKVTNEDLQDGVFSIPYGVRRIDDYAFSDCTSLLSGVIIPKSVTSIGGGAFQDCISLSKVIIPGSVRSIGEFAFSGCTSLSSVIISNGVQDIEGGAFFGCTNLSSVIIPESLTSIYGLEFFGCHSLTRVIIDTESSGKYERIASLLCLVLPKYVRSKKAYLIVLQHYRVFSSPLFSFQGPLVGHQDLMQTLEDYQNPPEDEDYLQLKETLYAEMPPSLSGNEQEWEEYEERLRKIGKEWEEKYKEKPVITDDKFIAYRHLQISQKTLNNESPINTVLYRLFGRLSHALIIGKKVVLDDSEKALLQRQKTLLGKIPDSILSQWGVAAIGVTSVNAAFYSGRAEERESTSAAQVAPSATNGG